MLQKVLQYIRTSRGAFNLASLSQELQIEPAALEGMLQTLIQQGKLEVEQDLCSKCSSLSAAADESCCEKTCGDAGNCPFASTLPRRFILSRDKVKI